MLIIPILPLRDIVVFPQMVVPLFVGRDKSIQALDAVTAQTENRNILLVAQKNPITDSPVEADIHTIGVIGSILQVLSCLTAQLKCW